MIGFGLGVFVGVIVGWNVLPQPEWAKTTYEQTREAVKKAYGRWFS
jgi:hypothetical protein